MTTAQPTPHWGIFADDDNGWRPIATARWDGTPHLIFCPEKASMRSTFNHNGDHARGMMYVVSAIDHPRRIDACFGNALGETLGEPSHWMPLPKPPSKGMDTYQASRKTALDAADALRQFIVKAYPPGHITFDLIAVIESAIPKEADNGAD